MKIDKSAKKQMIRGCLGFVLFIVSITACSNSTTKTPPPATATKSPGPTSYQFVLEKSLGRGIVEAADWAPDGSSLALATSVQVDIYDARTFEIVATLDTKQWTKVIAYSLDSRMLAAGSEDGTIQMWDTASRKLVHKLIPSEKHLFDWRDPVLAFSHDSQRLVSAFDQTLYLWDVNTGELLDSFPGHMDGIYKVAISPDGKTVIAAGSSTLHVRDVSTRELLYPPIPLQGSVEAILFDQDTRRFKTVNSDWKMNYTTGTTDDTTKIQTWDLASGSMLEEQLATHTQISLVDDVPARKQIVLEREGEIGMWDVSQNKVVSFMQGKTSRLASIAVSPDGKDLITVGDDWGNGLTQVWDLSSQSAIKTFDQYNLSPKYVAFSPDEKLVAISGKNYITEIREVRSGQLLHSYSGGGPVAFSPDSKTMAFATDQTDAMVMLADIDTGEISPVFKFSCRGLEGIAFAPDGKTLAFGGSNYGGAGCDVQLRDVQTGKLVLDLNQVEGNEYLASHQPIFSPDGKRIILGGYKPRVLDVKTGKTLREMETFPSSKVAISPDGRYLLVSGAGTYTEKEKLQVWDVAADRVAFNISTLQNEYDLSNLTFSPDGHFFAIVGKTVELWDLWRGKPLAELKPSGDPPVGLMISADNRTLVTLETNGTLQYWTIQPALQLAFDSLSTPTALPTLTATPVLPTVELKQVAELGKGPSSPVSYSSDGRLAAFVEENQLKWFDAHNLKQLGSVEVEDAYGPVLFSPDDKTVVVRGLGAQVIDLEEQAIVGRLFGGNGGTSGYTFSSDSHFLAYRDDDHTTGGPYYQIRLWDVIERKEAFPEYEYFHTLLEERYHTMSAPAISPDGKLVAAGHSDKRVYIWDLHTGESYLTLEGHADEVTAVDFSPNGSILASASLDGTVRLWDPRTGRLNKVLTGFQDAIDDMRFSADGRSLEIYYSEGDPQMVSLSTGKISLMPIIEETPDPLEMQQYQRGFSENGSIFSKVLFSPDGKVMALAGQNILLWDVSTEKLLTFLDNSTGGLVRGIAFNAEGTLLAVTTDNDDVIAWDVQTGKQLFHQKSNFLFGDTVIAGVGDSGPGLARGGSTLAEQGLAFSPADDLLAFSNDNAIEIWNIRTTKKVSEFINPSGSYATQFSFSEDSKRLYVVLNRNRGAQIWDTTSGKLIRQIQLTDVDANAYTAVALRAPWFVRNNSDSTGNAWIELWNLDKEDFIKIITPTSQNEPLVISPDGSLLTAEIGGSGIHFWKTATGELIYQTELDSSGLAISMANRWLAVGQSAKALIYDLSPILSLSGRAESQTPQATSTPLTFAWPTPTPAPLPTKSAEIQSNVLGPENASRIVEKARFGAGTIEQLAWSSTGDSITIVGSLGVSQYSFQDSTKTWSANILTEKAGWTYKTVKLPDGRTIATSVDSGRVRVWDVSTGKDLVNLEGGGEPAISPDGSLLVYTDSHDVLQIWDVAKAQPVATLKSGYSYSLRPIFSPDGKWVAAVQSLRRYADWIRVWNARTGEIVNALGGPDNDITDFSFSADGRFLIGAAGGSAWIWDLHPGTEPEEIQLYEGKVDWNLNVYPNTVTAVTLSPNDQVIAIGTSENDIQVYDRKTQQPLFQLKGHSSAIHRLSFNPDGKMLASVDEDGVLIIWDLVSRQRMALLDDHKGAIDGLVYRTDGDLAAWGAGAVWQIDPRDEVLQHTTSIHSGKILAVSPTGDLLAVYNPFQVSLLDARDGKFIQTLEGEAQEPELDYRLERAAFRQFYAAAFSQDGRYLATAGAGGIWYYDIASRTLLQQLPGSNAQKVAISTDGKWLLTSLEEQTNPVAVYDIQSGSQLLALDEYGSRGAKSLRSAFSTDGHWVATFKTGWDAPPELLIYDTVSSRMYKSIPLDKDILLTSLVFSPSGNLILAGTVDGKVLLIDFATLKTITTLTGHHGAVDHLIFSPDGQYLISASTDGTVRTWGLP